MLSMFWLELNHISVIRLFLSILIIFQEKYPTHPSGDKNKGSGAFLK